MEAKGELTRKRVGLKVVGRGIVREHERVLVDGQEVGHTTSARIAPIWAGRTPWPC